MNWLIWSLLDIVKNLLTSFTHWPVVLSYTVIDPLFCCLQRSEQDSESVEAFNPHLSYVYKDRSVIEDAASLILHHMKRQAGQLHHLSLSLSLICQLTWYFNHVNLLYTPQTKFGGYIVTDPYVRSFVCPSVPISNPLLLLDRWTEFHETFRNCSLHDAILNLLF